MTNFKNRYFDLKRRYLNSKLRDLKYRYKKFLSGYERMIYTFKLWQQIMKTRKLPKGYTMSIIEHYWSSLNADRINNSSILLY